MPLRFEFDAEHRILLIVLEGEIRAADVESFNDHVRQHVQQLEPSGAIADFSAITTFQVAGEIFRRAAIQPSPFHPDMPRYIVAPTDYLFGMARMYQLAADRPNDTLKVVRRMEDAYSALGVKNPSFARLP